MATARMNLAPVIKAALDRLGVEAGVVGEVLEERARQDAKWGEQNHPDGTGPQLVWPFTGPASHVAEAARLDCQRAAAVGHSTWQRILLEEVAEAFAEDDPAALRTELIQVAAVCVQWVQAIDRRRAARAADQ